MAAFLAAWFLESVDCSGGGGETFRLSFRKEVGTNHSTEDLMKIAINAFYMRKEQKDQLFCNG
jgi:hypothetical protein